MWYHTATGSYYEDLTITPGELNPREINLAALYLHKHSLPDLPYPALYKLFRFRPPARQVSAGTPAVGIAWAVPEDQITQIQNFIADTEPHATWWNPAQQRCLVEEFPGVMINNKMNHAALFKYFDLGHKSRAIAETLGLDKAALHYVYKKWKNNLPAAYQHKSTRVLDHSAIVADLQAGLLTTLEIGIKYECTSVTVRNIARKNKIP